MSRRILIASFSHETNTFSVMKADMAAFRARRLIEGCAVSRFYAGTKTEMAGFLEACTAFGWTAVPVIAADATPSGPVTREVFDHVTGRILAAIRRGPRSDALLLALHGAMVCEHLEDGEGELLRLIRAEVGRAMPVAVTLDLHANVTDAMARHADILLSCRKYPHTDTYETGLECARLLRRVLDGEVQATVHVARAATIDGVDMGRTTAPGPMLDAQALAERLTAETPGVLALSINAGFAWADIRDAGPTAVVIGDGASPRYQAVAETIAAYIFDRRAERTVSPMTARAAVARAKSVGRPGAPALLADYADNPGGGGYGDTTGLLSEMLAAGLDDAAFGPIYDPACAAQCHEAGVGAGVRLSLGGKIDPSLGAPIALEGTVAALSDGRVRIEGPMNAGLPFEMGPSAAVRTGGLEIVIASRRFQNYDRVFFTALGIDPAHRAVLGIKSAQHFRAAYAPIAGEILIVDEGGGIMTHDLKRFSYRNVRRPVWPLDGG